VAFTYNDPVVFLEYAVDVADACRARGLKAVAVTAGYMTEQSRPDLYAHMDAANVDLKGFTESFYQSLCSGQLAAVRETLVYLKRETDVWLEITTLVIPGENDADADLHALAGWVRDDLGPDVPVHFTAFHPDWRMTATPPTPPATLTRARTIAKEEGLRHVYTGNVVDPRGGSTWCPGCGLRLIERDWYRLGHWTLTVPKDGGSAFCPACRTEIPGVFEARPGTWGARRLPVRLQSGGR
jgi:pyruvate formate lyase activating enzyme